MPLTASVIHFSSCRARTPKPRSAAATRCRASQEHCWLKWRWSARKIRRGRQSFSQSMVGQPQPARHSLANGRPIRHPSGSWPVDRAAHDTEAGGLVKRIHYGFCSAAMVYGGEKHNHYLRNKLRFERRQRKHRPTHPLMPTLATTAMTLPDGWRIEGAAGGTYTGTMSTPRRAAGENTS